MNETLGLAHFFTHTDAVARGVLALLLIGSVLSWYLIVRKGRVLLRTHRQSQAFLKKFWDAPHLEALASEIRVSGAPEPFSRLLQQGFAALDLLRHRHAATHLVHSGASDDMLTRALRRAIEQTKAQLEFGQTFLATVASSAPFVGLLGTVWGIYHALIAIGVSGQAGLDKVAGPVGEALIMTGIGLAVAIPAAIAYNSFARASRNTLTQLNSFAYDVHNFLAMGITAAPLADAARPSPGSSQPVSLRAPAPAVSARAGGAA